MTKYRNSAIVFGGGINGLGLIRNLGRNGIDIYCVVDKTDTAIFSKYCKKHFIVPHIQEEKGILRSFLKRLEKKLTDYALLFSTTDLFSLHLSDLKDELEGNYHVLLPNAKVVRTLVNKREFYQSLSNHKIPCPITYFPNSSEDVKKISKEIKYPIFLKPSISQIFDRVFHKKGFLASSTNELMNYYILSSTFKIDTIIQEVIPGPARNLYGIAGYFNRKSLPKALFAYRRLREWPPLFGTNSLMESIPISDVTSIKETTKTYLHQLGYHGIMEAEFKRDTQDGIFKLLEINARSWWQNSFPTKCRINIVFMAYLDAIAERIDYTKNYEAGTKWMYFWNDFISSIKMFKNEENNR
jgi:predicted ATP-grasp superfamily ATP-dependent carboligase